MYVDVKMGKRGEVVIPAFVRNMFKMRPGELLKLNVKEEEVSFVVEKKNVVEWFRETAKREGVPREKLIYGDKLYEEVLG